jgi:hypothetical protein
VSVSFDRIEEGCDLSFLEPFEYKLQGSRLLIVCNRPADVIVETVEYARARGLKILDIKISPPTLEDVFVKVAKGE